MKKLFGTLLLAVASTAASHAQVCDESGLLVSVSPSPAKPGQLVTVSVTNLLSNCVYTTPSLCLSFEVHVDDCTGPVVWWPHCAHIPTPLNPGQTRTMTWNQKDDLFKQVPEGTYVFKIEFLASGTNPAFDICPEVVISDCATPPMQYGMGDAGFGGFIPKLTTGGQNPDIGNHNFKLIIEDAVGGAPALLFVGVANGAVAAGWGTFLIDPVQPFLQLPLALGGAPGAASEGTITLPAPIPSSSALIGLSAYLQALVGDPSSTGGISHTAGLQITICK